MGKILDITGDKYGRLTAIERISVNPVLWRFKCDCGNTKSIGPGQVRYGNTRSCGCIKREQTAKRFTKHGYAGGGRKSEYRSWQAMITRCENKNNPAYPRYGGRGIKICRRWRKSFSVFLADVGLKPSPKHSIDRYPDNDGDYKPSNVRWATSSEQSYNRRSPRALTFMGESHPRNFWAKKIGICDRTITDRLNRGWTVEKTLTTMKLTLGNLHGRKL